MTIGNILKSICRKPKRRAQILITYLPTTKLEHIASKAACRRTLSNLIHSCLDHILSPLGTAGVDGVLMFSGDGVTRWIHPIVACYSADYPEQILVTGVPSKQCPKCTVPHDELGNHGADYPLRNLEEVLVALRLVDEDPTRFW